MGITKHLESSAGKHHGWLPQHKCCIYQLNIPSTSPPLGMPTWWHLPLTTPGCSAKLQTWSFTLSRTDSTSCKRCVCRARRRPHPSYASSSEPWRVCTHKQSKSWPSMTCWSCRDQNWQWLITESRGLLDPRWTHATCVGFP